MAMNLGSGLMLGGFATGLEHQRKLQIEEEKADAELELRKVQAKKGDREGAEKNYKDLKEGYEGLIKQMVVKIEAENIQPDDKRFQAMTQFVPTAIKRIADARTAAYGGDANDNLTSVGDQVLGHLGAAKDKNITGFADAAADSINKITKAKLRTSYSEGVSTGQAAAGKIDTELAEGVPGKEGAGKGQAAVAAAPGMGQAELSTAATGGAAATGLRQRATTLNSPITTPAGGNTIIMGGGPGPAAPGLGNGLLPPVTAAPRAPVVAAPVAPPAGMPAAIAPAVPVPAVPPSAAIPVPPPGLSVPPPGAVPVPGAGAGAPRPGMSPTDTFSNGGAMPLAPTVRQLPGGGTVITSPGSAAQAQPEIIEKDLGELYVDIQKRARGLRTQMQSLDRIDQTLDQVETGKFTGAAVELKAMAKGLGVDLNALGIKDDVGPAQAAQALTREMALQLRNPAGGAGMPGAMSDPDRKFLESMVPGLEMTREGRKLIVEAKRAELKREVEVAAFTREYARSKGGVLDQHFEDVLGQKFATMPPMFVDAQRQRLQFALPAPVPGASDANPAGDPAKRVAGQVYMTPAGPKRWTGQGWDE